MARAAQADDVVGDWLVASRDAVIRIVDQDGVFSGSLVWLLHTTYGPEDGAKAGQVVVDDHNPDPALRTRPLLGLTILHGLKFDGDGTWADGHVYNSDNGKTYGAEIRMLGPDRLKMRGYIGIPLLGGSTEWTRVRQLPPPP